MASNDYCFVTCWKVKGTCEEVSEILGDASGLTRWWPSVYLDVKVLEPGGAHGVGKKVELHTRGWLPYTLRWWFRTTESRFPHGWTLEAFGDFVGKGDWTLEQRGDEVEIRYDWRIRADKPLLKYFSFAFKPFFSANHQWAMKRGEQSLKLELLRRRARTPEERAQIPPPPGR